MAETRTGADRNETRENLVEVAARLLREQGVAAVTTRAVALAAGVQAPAIYRLFGDKDGLLDAVAEHVLADYVAGKSVTAETDDPIADLRTAWFAHVDFGLANGALFLLMCDPGRDRRPAASPAWAAGAQVLGHRVRRVAAIGRLRVGERRAVDLIRAAGTGTVLTLLTTAADDRDPGFADAMYDTLTQTILTDAPALPDEPATAAAVTFQTVVPDLTPLTPAERALLSEWLDRASAGR
jgi:AcrR family transcriptional regulator